MHQPSDLQTVTVGLGCECGAARDGLFVLPACLKQQPGRPKAAAVLLAHSAVSFLHLSVLLSGRAEVTALV